MLRPTIRKNAETTLGSRLKLTGYVEHDKDKAFSLNVYRLRKYMNKS